VIENIVRDIIGNTIRVIIENPIIDIIQNTVRDIIETKQLGNLSTLLSLLLSSHYNVVPPKKVIIKDEKLEPLNEVAGPYEEDSDVKLTCEAKGGKCRKNLMALVV